MKILPTEVIKNTLVRLGFVGSVTAATHIQQISSGLPDEAKAIAIAAATSLTAFAAILQTGRGAAAQSSQNEQIQKAACAAISEIIQKTELEHSEDNGNRNQLANIAKNLWEVNVLDNRAIRDALAVHAAEFKESQVLPQSEWLRLLTAICDGGHLTFYGGTLESMAANLENQFVAKFIDHITSEFTRDPSAALKVILMMVGDISANIALLNAESADRHNEVLEKLEGLNALSTASKPILPDHEVINSNYSLGLFVGADRVADRDQLSSILRNHSEAYLCGEPGIGKTHTAHAFVDTYKEQFRAVFWVNAADKTLLIQSIIEISVALGKKRDEGDTQEKADFINTWLQSNPNALFVFDNAGQTLREIEALNLHLNKAKVLYTVLDHLAGSPETRVVLKTMSPEAGAELILKRAELKLNESNQQEAKNISKELGGLPLALDQAGFLIKDGVNLESYFDTYKKERQKILKRRGHKGREHPESVWVTYNQLLELLESKDSEARQRLNLLACMEPDNIPENVLNIYSEVVLANLTALWRSLGLVRCSQDEKTQIQLFSLHRLNHEILNILLNEEKQEEAEMKKAVDALLLNFPDSENPSQWDTCALYAPHATCTARRAINLNLKTDDVAKLLNTAGTYLTRVRRLDEAVAAYEEALDIRRALATQQPEVYRPNVAMTLNNLGIALSGLRRLDEAVAAFEEALGLYRDLAAEQPAVYTPDVAMTLNNLGIALDGLRRLDEAVAVYVEALGLYRALARQQPEVYRPNVALTLNNLGAALRGLRRLDEALAAYEEALGLYRDLATQQPDLYRPKVAGTLNNLGIALSDLRRLDEAVTAYKEALDIRRDLARQQPEVYRPDVAGTLNNLGLALNDLRRLDEAEAAYVEALGLYRDLARQQPEVYRPDVAATLNNLGLALFELRRLNEALVAYEEALDIRRDLARQQPEVYRPNVAGTLYNLGNALFELRRLNEAVAAYEEALCLFLRAPSFGLEHPWTQGTRDNLMRAYRESGKGLVEANRLANGILRKAMEADEPCG